MDRHTEFRIKELVKFTMMIRELPLNNDDERVLNLRQDAKELRAALLSFQASYNAIWGSDD